VTSPAAELGTAARSHGERRQTRSSRKKPPTGYDLGMADVTIEIIKNGPFIVKGEAAEPESGVPLQRYRFTSRIRLR
jgi:hypothetical protein